LAFKDGDIQFYGQLNSRTKKPHGGIARCVLADEYIVEGMLIKDEIHGFGRCIYYSGSYHIGWFHDNQPHGYGQGNFFN